MWGIPLEPSHIAPQDSFQVGFRSSILSLGVYEAFGTVPAIFIFLSSGPLAAPAHLRGLTCMISKIFTLPVFFETWHPLVVRHGDHDSAL